MLNDSAAHSLGYVYMQRYLCTCPLWLSYCRSTTCALQTPAMDAHGCVISRGEDMTASGTLIERLDKALRAQLDSMWDIQAQIRTPVVPVGGQCLF